MPPVQVPPPDPPSKLQPRQSSKVVTLCLIIAWGTHNFYCTPGKILLDFAFSYKMES